MMNPVILQSEKHVNEHLNRKKTTPALQTCSSPQTVTPENNHHTYQEDNTGC